MILEVVIESPQIILGNETIFSIQHIDNSKTLAPYKPTRIEKPKICPYELASAQTWFLTTYHITIPNDIDRIQAMHLASDLSDQLDKEFNITIKCTFKKIIT